MRHNRLLLLLPLVVLVAGCDETPSKVSKTMGSWVGHPVSELIAVWGPPARTFSDGKGGEVYLYATTHSFATSRPTTRTTIDLKTDGSRTRGTATTIYDPGETVQYTTTRTFFVDSDGRIYNWAWRGLQPGCCMAGLMSLPQGCSSPALGMDFVVTAVTESVTGSASPPTNQAGRPVTRAR